MAWGWIPWAATALISLFGGGKKREPYKSPYLSKADEATWQNIQKRLKGEGIDLSKVGAFPGWWQKGLQQRDVSLAQQDLQKYLAGQLGYEAQTTQEGYGSYMRQQTLIKLLSDLWKAYYLSKDKDDEVDWENIAKDIPPASTW